jgi:hypothetical protein
MVIVWMVVVSTIVIVVNVVMIVRVVVIMTIIVVIIRMVIVMIIWPVVITVVVVVNLLNVGLQPLLGDGRRCRVNAKDGLDDTATVIAAPAIAARTPLVIRRGIMVSCKAAQQLEVFTFAAGQDLNVVSLRLFWCLLKGL